MNSAGFPYKIFSLGDAALTIDFGNHIDEKINREVIARVRQLKKKPFSGLIEVVPAYSSFTVYYDIMILRHSSPVATAFESVKKEIQKIMQESPVYDDVDKEIKRIAVCYDEEYAPDLQYLAAEKKLSVEQVIQIHISRVYKVYMLGFLPGFSYMGEVDEQIAMPRKPQPHTVAAGAIGIAGKQTGIYPLESPGGWQIIGRTPLKLFDINKEEAPAFLEAGDRVQFYQITKNEFKTY